MPLCSGQPHTCRWHDQAAMVDDILTRYTAGITGKELELAYRMPHARLVKILETHGVQRRSIAAAHHLLRSERGLTRTEMDTAGLRCRRGRHICIWSDQADAIDQLLRDYRAGSSLRELSERLPYSRGTVTKILTEHDVRIRSASGARRGRPVAESARPPAEPVGCGRGHHVCLWSNGSGELDQLLDDYGAGSSVRDLSRRSTWSHTTLSRILDAHGQRVRTAAEQRALAPAEPEPVSPRSGSSLRCCQPGQHVCQWKQRGDELDKLIAGHRSGLPADHLADTGPFNLSTISDILAEHEADSTGGNSWWRHGRAEQCRPGRHRCRYAPMGDALDQLLSEYESGSAVNVLSKHYGVARGTVVRILQTHAVRPRGRAEQRIRVHLRMDQIEERLRDGETLTQVAADCGLSRMGLRKRLAEHRSAVAARTGCADRSAAGIVASHDHG